VSELDEIVGEFLVESYENLDQFDEDLLALERDAADLDVVSSIFRTIHTVKGTSGFFGFGQLEALAHVAENLLGRIRDGELAATEDIASALLATGDTIRRMLSVIERTGEEGNEDVSELEATLTSLLEGVETGEATESAVTGDGDDGSGPSGDADGARPPLGELLVDRGIVDADTVEFAVREQELGDDRRLGEILVGQMEDEVTEALGQQEAKGGLSDTKIRVDVGLLDELMNLVGELVLARNQIVQLVNEEQDSQFSGASQRLNLITTELQEGVMKTRMQPIGNVWNKLPRVVRDLSLGCGKQVDLQMVGQDTELDKTIIEAIKDPLTHLVRNAVDHGIEEPEARVAAGKAATGKLVLRAFHEGGQVNIEIADDGAGIDPDAIRAKAIEKGVITADQASRLGDREALHLIFAPGFSTAKQVTNVSGRGVGMDVVRTNIERIGGTVDVVTESGAGTTFKVKIPLTLAIVPALVVSSQGDRYAIPQLSLTELVRLDGESARSGIELVHGAPVHRLRGQLLPIVDLATELGAAEVEPRDVINIVVLHADGQQFGLVVDEIHDTQEIVVKPLGAHLKDATLFAGATIMGDGNVALILDVLGTAQRARVVSEGRERTVLADEDESAGAASERRTLLLVGLGEDRRAAIALSEVERLEEFAADTVEWAGGREVVQYRDDILPVLRLGDLLGVASGYQEPEEPLNVVVHGGQDRSVGLMVGRILDIVDQDVVLSGGDGRPGLLGSAVIQGRVTDVLDVDTLLAANEPAGHAGAYAGAF
jgi:two-component system, chemotaxis family, sensor kinase CheA